MLHIATNPIAVSTPREKGNPNMLRITTITIASALLAASGCSSDSERTVSTDAASDAPVPAAPARPAEETPIGAIEDNPLLAMDMGDMMTEMAAEAATGSDLPAPAAVVTGEEPECLAGFGRVAECYLTRDTCDPSAVNRAQDFGYILSVVNCPPLNDMGVSPQLLSMFLNADTPCDDPDIQANSDAFDMGAIADLCTAPPMTDEDCTAACSNIVPCAGQFSSPDFQNALGNDVGCNMNCIMDPLNVLGYPCTAEDTECNSVVACFEGEPMP